MDIKGKNDIRSSINLTFERAKYKDYVKKNSNKTVQDFNFVEYAQYGRIDPSMNVVYNEGQFMKRIPTGNGTFVSAVDFVADAFNAVVTKFDQARSQRLIPSDDKYLSKIVPFRGYENPISAYEAYLARMLTNYNEIFLQDYRVKNFDDYFKFFLDYSTRMGYNYPMTFTGFQRSKHSNVFTSGLAISISDLQCDDDEQKVKFFINSPIFEFYKNVCINSGFLISENTPWVLVADLISPPLSLYTNFYNLSSKNSIFLRYFNDTIDEDINLLINNLLIYYKKYYNNIVYYNNIELCDKNKIIVNKVFLQNINLREIEKKYTDEYIYETYIRLRNIEEYNYYKEDRIKEIIKNSKKLQKIFDNSRAISYIKEEFRKIHKFRNGNLNDINDKLKRRANDISDTG